MADAAASGGARRAGPPLFLAVFAAAGALITGVVFSRPDVIAIGVPLALWAAIAVTNTGRGGVDVRIERTPDAEEGVLADDIVVDSDAEMVELAVAQVGRTRRRLFVPGRTRVRATSRPRHSGPVTTVQVAARALDVDAALLGVPRTAISLVRTVQPVLRRLPLLPLAPRLTGLHGSHEGVRPGQGGDFRDIHPFAPGDELRRVDWKATARAARRPGELLIRRTNTLSDASAVIVMDTADDLGEVVATWGTLDLARSGVTSLDHARSAARSIAAATVEQGDRVAFHTLAHGGRSVRSGSGRRHLARIVAEISSTGRGGDDARFRRMPPVPHGSIIYVLSTFFDGAAAEIATRWRAAGHRVVAADILPELDEHRLSTERTLALRVLLAEREDMMHQLREAGVETMRWADDPGPQLTALTRSGRVRAAGRPR
ncbi:DUF58 domain-containing protein [Microbacterium arabinogalactanolyticum]|uniref:DUF58 domain-containing protein n=1 Tax=Microbacterium arabinogalactanolyticum TaxID=69365 RepID=A0ABQ5ND84_9MICO|nr:DUF58 domain-containing protein [Microbacterium arabinogalactanolyticum]GLC83665.1 hypothetical protein MIAR_02530 [Microbacterium arabinogalactanolyticum]